MSPPTARREEVWRLRQEGYDGRIAGKHRQHYPPQYNGTTNLQHWLEGWDAADEMLALRQHNYAELRDAVAVLLDELEELGFGTTTAFDDHPAISGADTVDVINAHFRTLCKLVRQENPPLTW